MPPERVHVRINLLEDVPIYRQIVTQIHYQVAAGALEPDAALPSIRCMALELNVAPNTIAKAYEQLEGAGVVRKRRGFGTFVALEHAQTVARERDRLIEGRIDTLLSEARQLNFTVESLLALIHRRNAYTAPEKS